MPSPSAEMVAADSIWVVLTAVLVMFMQAGFALLETGSTRSKNAGHVASKNLLSFGIATLVFFAVGFGIAFGNGNTIIGTSGFFLNVSDNRVNDVFSSLSFSTVPLGAKYLFELVFAAVSLAIVWGGLAERAKLIVYFIFGIVFSAIIYPVIGHWIWGGGWLSELGMQDFAGSTVVHLQGGVAALIGAILLGPRIGKFNADGTPNNLRGHNLVYTVLGTFILWFGWFGFNPGSTLAASGAFFAYVAMTTNIAAAAGGVVGMLVAWAHSGKPDIVAMVNGVLGALVAITASCAYVEPGGAVIVGAVAGLISYFGVLMVERWWKVDDPIGAFGVHGLCGIWGTLATGFLASPRLVHTVGIGNPGLFYGGGVHQLLVQLEGILACGAFTAAASFIVLYAIKKTVGLRVTSEEELLGLDMSEHGTWGYPEVFEDRTAAANDSQK
ncbi:MAG: ammonium transporter [Firmicutes bacterium]|nr:ammonium transporter [Bacillota bacterium]